METTAEKREKGVSTSPGECLSQSEQGQREDTYGKVHTTKQRLYGLYVKGFIKNVCVNWLVDTGAAKTILSHDLFERLPELSDYETHSVKMFLRTAVKSEHVVQPQ